MHERVYVRVGISEKKICRTTKKAKSNALKYV